MKLKMFRGYSSFILAVIPDGSTFELLACGDSYSATYLDKMQDFLSAFTQIEDSEEIEAISNVVKSLQPYYKTYTIAEVNNYLTGVRRYETIISTLRTIDDVIGTRRLSEKFDELTDATTGIQGMIEENQDSLVEIKDRIDAVFETATEVKEQAACNGRDQNVLLQDVRRIQDKMADEEMTNGIQNVRNDISDVIGEVDTAKDKIIDRIIDELNRSLTNSTADVTSRIDESTISITQKVISEAVKTNELVTATCKSAYDDYVALKASFDNSYERAINAWSEALNAIQKDLTANASISADVQSLAGVLERLEALKRTFASYATLLEDMNNVAKSIDDDVNANADLVKQVGNVTADVKNSLTGFSSSLQKSLDTVLATNEDFSDNFREQLKSLAEVKEQHDNFETARNGIEMLLLALLSVDKVKNWVDSKTKRFESEEDVL